MPQFGVFRNPGREMHAIPYVLKIQSNRLEHSAFRVVMALPRRLAPGPPDRDLHPDLTILGEAVFANPLNIVTLRRSVLQNVLEILAERDQDRIIRAIDTLISRA